MGGTPFEVLFPNEHEAMLRAGIPSSVAELFDHMLDLGARDGEVAAMSAAIEECCAWLVENAEAFTDRPAFTEQVADTYTLESYCARISPAYRDDSRELLGRIVRLVLEHKEDLCDADPKRRLRALVEIRREYPYENAHHLMALAFDLGVHEAFAAYELRKYLESEAAREVRKQSANRRFAEDLVALAESHAEEWLPALPRRVVREVALRIAERYAPVEPWLKRRLLEA